MGSSTWGRDPYPISEFREIQPFRTNSTQSHTWGPLWWGVSRLGRWSWPRLHDRRFRKRYNYPQRPLEVLEDLCRSDKLTPLFIDLQSIPIEAESGLWGADFSATQAMPQAGRPPEIRRSDRAKKPSICWNKDASFIPLPPRSAKKKIPEEPGKLLL